MIRRNIKKGWEFVLRCFSLHMERMGPEQRVIVPNNPTLDLAGAGNPRDGGMGCRQLAYCTYGYSKYTFLYVSPDDVYQPHTVLWRSSLSLPLFFLSGLAATGRQGRAPAHAIGHGGVHANKHTKDPPSTRRRP
jgi:hypothetical protein